MKTPENMSLLEREQHEIKATFWRDLPKLCYAAVANIYIEQADVEHPQGFDPVDYYLLIVLDKDTIRFGLVPYEDTIGIRENHFLSRAILYEESMSLRALRKLTKIELTKMMSKKSLKKSLRSSALAILKMGL